MRLTPARAVRPAPPVKIKLATRIKKPAEMKPQASEEKLMSCLRLSCLLDAALASAAEHRQTTEGDQGERGGLWNGDQGDFDD